MVQVHANLPGTKAWFESILVMRPLFFLVAVASAACSSSSGDTGGGGSSDVGADTTPDTATPTDSGVAETVSLDDTAVDDTHTTNTDSAVDTSSSNKCAGV